MTTLAGSVRTDSVYQLHSGSYVMPRTLCGSSRPTKKANNVPSKEGVELLRGFYLIAVYVYWVSGGPTFSGCLLYCVTCRLVKCQDSCTLARVTII